MYIYRMHLYYSSGEHCHTRVQISFFQNFFAVVDPQVWGGLMMMMMIDDDDDDDDIFTEGN